MAQHAVILTPVEHQDLLEYKEIAERVLLHLTPVASRDEQEAVANVFLQHFDPKRGEEWGHVSFCFTEALRTLIHSNCR